MSETISFKMTFMTIDSNFLGVIVNSLLQFIEVVEILTATLAGEQCLIIIEGLNPMLLAQKVLLNIFTFDLPPSLY